MDWLQRSVRFGVHQSFSTPGLWRGRGASAFLRQGRRQSYSFWMIVLHVWFVQWHLLIHLDASRWNEVESTMLERRFSYCCRCALVSLSHRHFAGLSTIIVGSGVVLSGMEREKSRGRWSDGLSPSSKTTWFPASLEIFLDITKWSFHFLWPRLSWL